VLYRIPARFQGALQTIMQEILIVNGFRTG